MKNLLKYAFPIVILGLVSCKRDQVCECVDENLEEYVAYRESNYKGEFKSTAKACSQFKMNTNEELSKFEKSTKHCPNALKLQDEKILLIKHQVKEQKEKTMKMLDYVEDEMKSLDKLKDELNMK